MNIENMNNQESKIRFVQKIKTDGYCLINNIVSLKMVEKLRRETELALEKEIEFHGSSDYRDKGIIQCCPMYGGAFIDVLENQKLLDPFDLIMGEGNIIYVYISSCIPPNGKNFSTRIHVDRPWLFKDYCECLAGIVFLNDFSTENGATWVLPGSHNSIEKPNDDFFYQNAIQITGKAGSVLFFNLRLWHSGGYNKTNEWRHALAIGTVRPYLKQKFDYPRLIAEHNININQYSNKVKQKLGFFSIPPKNLNEYYGKNTKKTYLEKSEWEISNSKKQSL